MSLMRYPDVRRLMTIGDSVFAVSITLLAHAVTVPSHLAVDTTDSPEFRRFLVDIGGVVLSALVASLFWLGHWRYFRQVRSASVSLIVAHFAFLLGLILLPISTSFYVGNKLNALATLVYASNLLYMAVVAALFRHEALKHSPGAHRSPLLFAGQATVIALFTVSVLLSFVSPRAASTCWYVALASPLLEVWLARRVRSHQEAAKPQAATGAPHRHDGTDQQAS